MHEENSTRADCPAWFDRMAWPLFGIAAFIATILILWLGRDRTLSADEMTWFMQTPDLDLGGAIEPHAGHLILTTRLVYKAAFSVFGVGYLPFQLLTIGTVILTAGLFFAYAGRRAGQARGTGPGPGAARLRLRLHSSALGQRVHGDRCTRVRARRSPRPRPRRSPRRRHRLRPALPRGSHLHGRSAVCGRRGRVNRATGGPLAASVDRGDPGRHLRGLVAVGARLRLRLREPDQAQ